MAVHAPVSAQVLSHQQAKVDDKIVKADASYSVPTNIVVVPIFPPSSDFQVHDNDWFRGLYYYMIANERRPGFTDIPFHYIVTSDGRIFKGNSGGEERKISISGLGSDMVVIGYLAGRTDNAFDPRSMQPLSSLVLDVANRNSISLDKVSVATVQYKLDDQNQTVVLQKQDLFGLWGTSLKQVVDPVRGLYAPVPKQYAMTVTAVSLPDTSVNAGDVVTGSLTIKNTGDFGSYFDSSSELLGTKTEGGSKFFLQDVWPGNSQFNIMQQGDSLLPSEEKKYNFKLFAPLYFGDVSENFELFTTGGEKIADSGFTIKLNVVRPAGTKVVEIKPTETGWLRVRSQPSGAADEVARVSTGERYFVTDDAGNGWIQIKMTNGSTGWVSIQYLTFL